MTAREVKIGQRVKLTNIASTWARGQIGTVEKILKRRKAVRVRLGCTTFNAFISNIDRA